MTNEQIAIFGIPVYLHKYHVNDRLPFALTGDYEFYQGSILNLECVIVHFLGDYLSIPRVKLHFQKISEILNLDTPFILWLDNVNPTSRDRLIENGIPFYVNERIIFLPFLGTRLEESFKKSYSSIPDKFSTATQCVFLWLVHQERSDCPISVIINDLQLSKASVLRALKQLLSCGLVTIEGKATKKRYYRVDINQFWNIGKSRLRNPVIRSVYLEDNTQLKNLEAYSSGEEALAILSALQHPIHACKAVYKKRINLSAIHVTDRMDDLHSENYTTIEVWDYDPGLFAVSHAKQPKEALCVDLFSLYASLGILLNDIRIEKEIENVIEGYLNGRRS